MAESENELQLSLSKFEEYCKDWKLKVNTQKTKSNFCVGRKKIIDQANKAMYALNHKLQNIAITINIYIYN